MKNILGWFFGVFFLIGGIGLFDSSILAAVFSVIMSFLFIPPIKNIINRSTNGMLSTKVVIGLSIILFIGIGFNVDNVENIKQQPTTDVVSEDISSNIKIPVPELGYTMVPVEEILRKSDIETTEKLKEKFPELDSVGLYVLNSNTTESFLSTAYKYKNELQSLKNKDILFIAQRALVENDLKSALAEDFQDKDINELFKNKYCFLSSKIVFLINEGENVSLSSDNDNNCVVTAGEWKDFYTGDIIKNPNNVKVDYLVSLDDVYKSGGEQWLTNKKIEYVSDPSNFIVTSIELSDDRDGQTIEDWLPEDEYYACSFINKYGASKYYKDLSFLEDEIDVIEDWKGKEVTSKNGATMECKLRSIYKENLIFSDDLKKVIIRD